MQSIKFLTSLLISLGMLSGAAYAASTDASGALVDSDGRSNDAIQIHFEQSGGSEVVLGKGGKGGGGGGGGSPTATPQPTPIPCTGCPAMYVSVVTARYLDIGKGKLRQICDVEIRDESGNQVSGAFVTAQMTNDWVATLTEITQEQQYGPDDQFARFGPRDFKARCGSGGIDAFTCTVVDVTHESFTYDPGLDITDTSTASCPQ